MGDEGEEPALSISGLIECSIREPADDHWSDAEVLRLSGSRFGDMYLKSAPIDAWYPLRDEGGQARVGCRSRSKSPLVEVRRQRWARAPSDRSCSRKFPEAAKWRTPPEPAGRAPGNRAEVGSRHAARRPMPIHPQHAVAL